MKKRAKYPIEKQAEKLLDTIRWAIRKLTWWLTEPNKYMGDALMKISFILLAVSIVLKSKGY